MTSPITLPAISRQRLIRQAAGKTKSSYQTRFYHQHSDNDYTYLNKILVPTKPFRERRKEAQYDQFGVMQEAG